MGGRRAREMTRVAEVLAAGALALGLLLGAPGTAHAAVIEVDSLADDGSGGCTLREAITNANDDAATNADCAAGTGADTITFSESGTITLGSTLPTITDTDLLIIDGAGQITISGNNAWQIFFVNGGAALPALEIRGLTLTNGRHFVGAAIQLGNANVTVIDSTLRDNSAEEGGAISVGGVMASLTIRGSTFSGNDADGPGMSGGAIVIFTAGGGPVVISNSTFSGNTVSTGTGGAISVTAGDTVELTNVTITGNSAAGQGGGIRVDAGGAVNLTNTIIANNTAPTGPDCVGTVTSVNNNIIEDPSDCTVAGAGAVINADPFLGLLASNGGPTQTHALLTGSPAIDAGDNAACAAAPVNGVDQRGVTRPQGATCDIGAYEALQISIADIAQAEGDAGGTAFNAFVTLSAGIPAGFPDVTVDYGTADGTAVAASDYTAVAGTTLTFAAGGAATQNAAVDVAGDTTDEADETLVIDLSNA
ncbi:MAG: choice-of-anchor Q domain-containing protein, partial [Dehalococcoidia bacterium]